MAAGLGFKTFATGDVLSAADVNGYLMQGVLVFASAAARNAAITSPQEGQFAFTKDTNGLWYYDGAAWIASGATGDIEGVTAGTGITGGGTSGTVTITNDMATTITAAGDIVVGTGSGTYDNLPIGTTAQVLTADTTVSPYKVKWASPSSGSMTLLSTTTLSGTSTTISSISQSYINLLIVISGATWSGAASELRMLFNNANVCTGRGTYTASDHWENDNLKFTAANSTTGAGGNDHVVVVYQYATAIYKGYTNSGTAVPSAGGSAQAVWGGGEVTSTTAISSLVFNTANGNTFTAGTVKIYGVN
jgi:hypothetical protein